VHVQTTRLARLRAFELSPTAFRRIVAATTFALWLIVSTGAVVRLTSSGLGCEHWPGCEPGRPFPEKDYHAYIEFGNRLVGGVTIALTLALAVGAWLTRGLPRWARWLAVGTFAGTLAQAPLGAITVYAHLHPALVIPHLLLSIAVLGAAIVVAVETISLGRGYGTRLAREPRLAGLGIGAASFALIVSGSLATAAGPHSGGEDVYRLWSLRPALILHGAAVAVLGCSLMFLIGYLFARRSAARPYFRATVGLAGLVLGQMALGEIQYRTHLPWWLVLVHVAVAATVWSWTVALVTVMWRPPAAAKAGSA
jgi:cytochrome c oxidase assembly protein subunit 15